MFDPTIVMIVKICDQSIFHLHVYNNIIDAQVNLRQQLKHIFFNIQSLF